MVIRDEEWTQEDLRCLKAAIDTCHGPLDLYPVGWTDRQRKWWKLKQRLLRPFRRVRNSYPFIIAKYRLTGKP